MDINMSMLVECSVLITFICGAFNYIILRPFKDAINNLSEQIEKLSKTLKDDEQKIIKIETKLSELETLIKGAYARLDKIESKILDIIESKKGSGNHA